MQMVSSGFVIYVNGESIGAADNLEDAKNQAANLTNLENTYELTIISFVAPATSSKWEYDFQNKKWIHILSSRQAS